MMRWGGSRFVGVLAVALVLAAPGVARAELVRLTSGRVMPVDSCKFNGDMVTLALRSGGEMVAPRSIIAEILPDDGPRPQAVALELIVPAPPPVVVPAPDAIHGLVDRLAAQFSVDLKLAHAVVQVESNYQPNARSSKGAKGLMQLMPDVVQQYAVDDPYDPAKNLGAGLQYLRSLLDKFPSDLSRALAAYNAGEGAVARYGGVPPFPETRDYVRRVLALVGRR
jgi:hypothetical protein